MAERGKAAIYLVFKRILDSLRRNETGVLVGKDYYGNRFYELPRDPARGQPKTKRWYDPGPLAMNAPLIPEWESWLRMSRDNPPTEEEIAKHEAIARLKQKRAEDKEFARMIKDAERKKFEHQAKSGPYPVLKEYEITPGEFNNRNPDFDGQDQLGRSIKKKLGIDNDREKDTEGYVEYMKDFLEKENVLNKKKKK